MRKILVFQTEQIDKKEWIFISFDDDILAQAEQICGNKLIRTICTCPLPQVWSWCQRWQRWGGWEWQNEECNQFSRRVFSIPDLFSNLTAPAFLVRLPLSQCIYSSDVQMFKCLDVQIGSRYWFDHIFFKTDPDPTIFENRIQILMKIRHDLKTGSWSYNVLKTGFKFWSRSDLIRIPPYHKESDPHSWLWQFQRFNRPYVNRY